MTRINLQPLENGEDASAANFNARFNAVVDVINGKISSDNFSSGGIGTASIADNAVTSGKIEVQQSWQPVTYQNNWVDYDATYGGAQYHKDSLGIVRLRGLIKNGTNFGNSAFTLPAGYRPSVRGLYSCQSNNGIARVDVDAGGNVIPVVGNNSWISLANITFRAEG